VPSGFKFEYDTKRDAFNPSGNPLDPKNGGSRKMWQLKASAIPRELRRRATHLVFDASLDAAHSLPAIPAGRRARWAIAPPGQDCRQLYIATFATFAGVKLKALHDQMRRSPTACRCRRTIDADILHRALPRRRTPRSSSGRRWARSSSRSARCREVQREDSPPCSAARGLHGANAVNGFCSH